MLHAVRNVAFYRCPFNSNSRSAAEGMRNKSVNATKALKYLLIHRYTCSWSVCNLPRCPFPTSLLHFYPLPPCLYIHAHICKYTSSRFASVFQLCLLALIEILCMQLLLLLNIIVVVVSAVYHLIIVSALLFINFHKSKMFSFFAVFGK